MCRYHRSLEIDDCPVPFAEETLGRPDSPCPEINIQLNGSALPLYNSTTSFDKMAFAAAALSLVGALPPRMQGLQILQTAHASLRVSGKQL